MKKISVVALVFLLVLQTFISPLVANANTLTGLKQSFNFGEVEIVGKGQAKIPWEFIAGDEATERIYTYESDLKLDEEKSGLLSNELGNYTITVDGLITVTTLANQEINTKGTIEVTGIISDKTLKEEITKEEIENVKMRFLQLKVGDLSIKNSEDAKNIQLKENDFATVEYGFDLELEKPFAIGSTFTFQLPQSIVVFEQSALSGTIDVPGEPRFKYETNSEGLVTVTNLDELQTGEYNLLLNFAAKFGNFGGSEDLEQELEIPIKGSETISITLPFLPSSSNEVMTKAGNVESKDGKKYINWEVWTNRAGKELNDAVFNDVLGEGHTLVPGSIKVEKYKVGLHGVIDSSKELLSPSQTVFPISLDNGRFAYKVMYQTEVNRVPDEVTETFKNSASLTNNQSTIESVKNDVKITYGTPLSKLKTTGDKYKAGWEIHYNYLGAKIAEDEAEITDIVTGAHKIDPNTIKLYEVTVNEKGEEAVSSELKIDEDYTLALSDNDKKLVVNFNKSASEGFVTKAFKVTYDTISTEEFILVDSEVKNTVTSTNKDSSNNQYVKNGILDLGEGIFGKSRGPIDFSNKTITWKLDITAEKDLKNFKVVDTFTEIEGKSHQTLLETKEGNGNYFTITGYTGPTTPIVVDKSKGYTLQFNDIIPKGSKITITYKTKFDILPNGTAYERYGNEAIATWNGQTSNVNTITKEADYTPGDSPTGKNGYKNGKFNHVTQQFDWNIAVNINKQSINGATITDTLGAGHHIKDFKSISVKQLNLGEDDQNGNPGEILNANNYEISAVKTGDFVTGFTLTFKDLNSDQNNQAYIINYQTEDSDKIIGQSKDTASKYANTAVLKTNDTSTYEYPSEVDIKNANELISKKAVPNPNEETITWTVDVNKSHSSLGEIKLTDKPSANQLLLKDTFKVRKYSMSIDGEIKYGEWIDVKSSEIEFPTNGGFILDLGDLTKVGYQVEYKTFFTGGDKEDFNNLASINYTGSSGEDSKLEDGVKDKFVFNNSSGSISSEKGAVKLHKVGYNQVTKEKVNLPNVKFELYNKTGQYKLDEAISDEFGHVIFKNIRYGKYVIKEVEATTPEGYIKAPNISFTMNKETDTLVVGNENKILEEVINMKIIQGVKLTKVDADKKDENGQHLVTLKGAMFDLYHEDGTIVTIKDEDGKDKELSNLTTDDNGNIIVNNLAVGKYYFKETKAPEHYVLDSNEENNKTVTFEIKEKEVKLVEVVKENMRGLGKIIISKVDAADDSTYLEGVEFELSNKEGTFWKGTTNADGKVEFSNLPYDNYTLKEKKAKDGYALDTTETEVVLNSEVNDKTIIKNNKIIQAFELTKVDARNTNIVLKDADFKLMYKKLEKDEYAVVVGKEKLTTDINGKIYEENLEEGFYQLIETKAPSGYLLDNKPIEFKIEKEQIHVLPLRKENKRIPVIYPPDPENPGDSNKPENPEDPNKPENPEDPNKPENPEDPNKPENPEDPNKPENPEEPNKPEKPEDSNKPEKPEDPNKSENLGDSNELGNNGDSNDSNVNGDNVESTLPKTGDNNPIGMQLLGVISIMLGLLLWMKRNPTTQRTRFKD